MHNPEFRDEPVEHPGRIVSGGDEITVRIIEVDLTCHRVALPARNRNAVGVVQQAAGPARPVPRPSRRRIVCISAASNSPAAIGVPKKTASPAPMLASAVPAVSTRWLHATTTPAAASGSRTNQRRGSRAPLKVARTK
ncbi:hypothetical protein GTW66_09625 [Streptomyces sp. SID5473]|uniref:S1 motif domain-containing protein n=1 Tax=Streptomyces tsukubensis (strain DSM 42081 / NBRC 108919 / NRRL 18488 / 9993) TaxID=1114943 RepID=A0A7G3U7B7_STRT9|nr:hypothetical protein [Streptomyces sp. SID5473]QKM66354.1 hypothetical protein STSU_003440 [Streptomyces tsukubensis NRRL18488]TAI45306.1 hypothetical protein EWI31_08790 [Streptomyces tsukubensis]